MSEINWAASKYFRPETDPKLVCSHCGIDFMSPLMIEIANKIRREYGKPILVNSGVRCTHYNERIGGARDSYHIAMPNRRIHGMAIDMRPSKAGKMELNRLYKACDKILRGWGGIKTYTTFLHVDIREGCWRA